jgi:hypothetical protein
MFIKLYGIGGMEYDINVFHISCFATNTASKYKKTVILVSGAFFDLNADYNIDELTAEVEKMRANR